MSQPKRSKADEIKSKAVNLRESIGAGVTNSAPADLAAPRLAFGTVDQRRGYVKAKDSALIEVGRIEPDPEQPRTEFDREELERLADSLKRHGQLQPIRVRWDKEADHYRIIMGERRWRAAQLAGLASLACVVHEGALTDDQVKDLQLIENCLRSDLTPMERARAFKSRIDRTGCSVRQLATELSMTHTTINRALALLGLPPDVQEAVEAGRLSPSAGEEIAKLPPEKREDAAKEAQGKTRQQLRADRGVPSAAAPVERRVPPASPDNPGDRQAPTPGVERGVPLDEGQGGAGSEPRGVPKVPGTPIDPGNASVTKGKPKESAHVLNLRIPFDGYAMEYRVGFARVIVLMNPDTEDVETDAMKRAIRLHEQGKGERLDSPGG